MKKKTPKFKIGQWVKDRYGFSGKVVSIQNNPPYEIIYFIDNPEAQSFGKWLSIESSLDVMVPPKVVVTKTEVKTKETPKPKSKAELQKIVEDQKKAKLKKARGK